MHASWRDLVPAQYRRFSSHLLHVVQLADSCSISIDRRMTAGETWDSCLDEIRQLPACKKYGEDVVVSMYMYDRPLGLDWFIKPNVIFQHGSTGKRPSCSGVVDAHNKLFGVRAHW